MSTEYESRITGGRRRFGTLIDPFLGGIITTQENYDRNHIV
jgi:hypothetical protein